MFETTDGFNDIAKAIQLALAPVFLLTGIAGMLNVMAGRLSRIIDRVRTLTEGQTGARSTDPSAIDLELQTLERRRHFTSVAITACTVAALLVCVAIAALFLQVLIEASLKWCIAGVFTAATLALVVGLAYFLREVHSAMRGTRKPHANRRPGVP